MTTTKKNYLDTNTMFNEWVKSYQNGKISNELGLMFQKLSEKNANHRYFVRYTHIREELISEGVLGCIRGFKKFHPLRSEDPDAPIVWDGVCDIEYHHTTCNSPFSYYTRIIHNAFKQYLKQHEYKQRNINNSLREQNDLPTDEGYNEMLRTRSSDDLVETNLDSSFVDCDYDDDDYNFDPDDFDLDKSIHEALSSINTIGDDEPEEEEKILW